LRKVALKDQNVIAQSDIFELRHSSIEILTQHVEIVRLVVQNVTHSFELWVVPILFEMRSHSWIDQRNPAHDSAHTVMLGRQLQQPISFKQTLPGLDGHYPIDPGVLDGLQKLRNKKIPANRLHIFRYPRVVGM